MLSKFELVYKQSGGIQIPTAFKGRVPDVLPLVSSPLLEPNEKTSEQAGLNGPERKRNSGRRSD
jgi:hypothetical protein